MKNLLLIIFSMISLNLHAQYYYNDIVGTNETNNRMKIYQAQRVQSATGTGYDQFGNKSADFNEWQDVQGNGSILKVTTRNGQNVTRLYYEFDNNTRVISLRDSSSQVQTITNYTYDTKGNLIRVRISFLDSEKEFNDTEERQWTYTANNKPERVWRILNSKDTTEYRFTTDEYGNVADETLVRRFGNAKDTVYFSYESTRIYYYYDDQNRLTDVVKYDRNARQLLPDFMFEYDDKNRVIQKITVVSTTATDYFIWRYGFNDKGLKSREVLYNKYKQLKGKIDYAYTFAP